MENELSTGAWSLNNKGAGPLYGMVAAFGPSDSPGTVRLMLDRPDVQWEMNEEGQMTIDITEQQAREIAERLFEVAIKLEHLRLLERNRLWYGESTSEE